MRTRHRPLTNQGETPHTSSSPTQETTRTNAASRSSRWNSLVGTWMARIKQVHFWIPLALFLIVALCASWFLIDLGALTSASSDSHCRSIPVMRLRLNRSDTSGWAGLSYRELAHLRQPIILHGDELIVKQWKAWRTNMLEPEQLISRE
jgi:hypothetical protein